VTSDAAGCFDGSVWLDGAYLPSVAPLGNRAVEVPQMRVF